MSGMGEDEMARAVQRGIRQEREWRDKIGCVGCLSFLVGTLVAVAVAWAISLIGAARGVTFARDDLAPAIVPLIAFALVMWLTFRALRKGLKL